MHIRLRFLLLLIAGPCALMAQDDAWRTKTDPAILAALERDGQAAYIILLDTAADLRSAGRQPDKAARGAYVYQQLRTTAQSSQRDLLAYLEDQGLPHHAFFVVNGIYTRSNATQVAAIARRPEVKELVYDFKTAFQTPIESKAGSDRGPEEIAWGVLKIKADSVWMMGYQGQGVVVGGHDTGIEWNHPAIRNQYRGWNGANASHAYNWHDAIHTPSDTSASNPCGYDLTVPCDDNSHGTHTMGTIVGSEGSNQIGVAPAACWIGVRNMDEGNGTLFSYIEGFEWFMAPTDISGQNPDPTLAPHVINNSWYCSVGEGCNESNFDVLREVVDNVRAAGIVVVVSAGNSGPECASVTGPPGFFESSFSIGATNQQDSIAGFSSRGPVTIDGSMRLKPDVSAPGTGVNSCVPGGSYGTKSGTSMAAPHVSGVVALMISANPQLAGQVDEIETILEQTADFLYTDQVCNDLTGGDIPNFTYGYGRVNALRAVQAALEWNPPVGTTIADEGGAAVHLYPNPFSDWLRLESAGIEGPVQFSMFDISGRIVFRNALDLYRNDSRIFSTASLPSGLYFYEIASPAGIWTGKVSK